MFYYLQLTTDESATLSCVNDDVPSTAAPPLLPSSGKSIVVLDIFWIYTERLCHVAFSSYVLLSA